MWYAVGGTALDVVAYEIDNRMTDGSPHRRRNLDIVQKAQLHISEVKTKITDLLELPTEKRGEDFDGDLAKCTKLEPGPGAARGPA